MNLSVREGLKGEDITFRHTHLAEYSHIHISYGELICFARQMTLVTSNNRK